LVAPVGPWKLENLVEPPNQRRDQPLQRTAKLGPFGTVQATSVA
jgi:hypothetical protein